MKPYIEGRKLYSLITTMNVKVYFLAITFLATLV